MSGLQELVDKMEREAFDEWWSTESKPVYPENQDEEAKAWGAWQARAKHTTPCRGLTDSKCSYLAHCGVVCNKCGNVHDRQGSNNPMAKWPFAELKKVQK